MAKSPCGESVVASTPLIEAVDVSVSFARTMVLRKVSLAVFPGEMFVVLGDSGCGKTTLLKVLAGLQSADGGVVRIAGENIQDVSPRHRGVVYLDQEALLFDHLNVFENVAFALRLRKVSGADVALQVGEMLAAIGLNDHAEKRSWQLSGGQKQRIAFARAILARPRVLLLDEPFASLDARTRADMQQLVRHLSKRYQFTAVLVTHDVREALVLGDRFALISTGSLRCYRDRREFIEDDSTGVAEQMRFWQQVD